MNLKEFIDQKHAHYPIDTLVLDDELVRDIQGQLALVGLLDPPIDGKFGPVSRWALEVFCKKTNTLWSDELTTEIADVLLNKPADEIFPLRLGNDFPSRVIRAMQNKRYWVNRHPNCLNIIYVEGCNTDGTPNENKPNEFNDVRLLISIEDASPKLLGAWEATTEPGKFWTLNPMNPEGAARIAFGQYKSWAVGIHRAETPNAHEALVQVNDIVIYRDLNKDFQRIGDKSVVGVYMINQHWGYDRPREDICGASAGCLVGRTKNGHMTFMALVKKDPRYIVNNAYRFMTTVLPFSDL